MPYEVDNSSGHGASDMTKLKFSDIIQLFPTVEEYAAVRKSTEGSWFVKALTNVLSKPENTNSLEIIDLLAIISKELATFTGPVTTEKGYENLIQTFEYTVTGVSKKMYFPIR